MATAPPTNTALLDALIARGLGDVQGTPEIQQARPLEDVPQLPDPSPGSAPPLYGEAPGEGYMYARAPLVRQRAMVHTDPEVVRQVMLRSMEWLASSAPFPFSQEGAKNQADAVLKLAQAYLLIDPTVDAQGVPVAANLALQMASQQATAATSAAARPQPAGEGAHGTVKPGKTIGGHTSPPRVLPGAAAQTEAEMHEHAQELLQASRPSHPTPKPRPGA